MCQYKVLRVIYVHTVSIVAHYCKASLRWLIRSVVEVSAEIRDKV